MKCNVSDIHLISIDLSVMLKVYLQCIRQRGGVSGFNIPTVVGSSALYMLITTVMSVVCKLDIFFSVSPFAV